MSHDTWMHRLIRGAVRSLAATAITPNHLTTGRLLTGLAAAGFYAAGGTPWVWYGSGCFVVSILLDRADGELARQQNSASVAGHTYDLITDALCNTLVLVGIGVGLRAGPFGAWAIPMGIVAGLAVMYVLWLMIRLEAQAGQGSARLGATAGFDPDDAMLVVPLAMALRLEAALLVAATVGAPLAAILLRGKLGGRHPQQPEEGP